MKPRRTEAEQVATEVPYAKSFSRSSWARPLLSDRAILEGSFEADAALVFMMLGELKRRGGALGGGGKKKGRCKKKGMSFVRPRLLHNSGWVSKISTVL